MNGIINVIKPMGMSSHQVVAYLRRVLKTRRIGHAGTLDPGAGGLLTICVGHAAKLMQFMVEYDKAYVAEMTLTVNLHADGWYNRGGERDSDSNELATLAALGD